MSEIYLIRHGQASFGAKDYDRLSPVGLRQARILADHLFGLGIGFDAVYCGRLKRQKDTARAFCDRYGRQQPALGEPTVLGAFDEYDAKALLYARSLLARDEEAVSLEALDALRGDRRTFQAYFSDTVDRWLAGEYDGQADVTSWKDFNARVAGGVQRLVRDHQRGKRVAVFTSGGPICAVVKQALGLSDHTAIETNWQIMNASLTCIRYNGSRPPALSVFNNTTHLLLEQDPVLLTYR